MNFTGLKKFYSQPWAPAYLAFLAGFFILPYEQGRLHKNGFALFVILFVVVSFKTINWQCLKNSMILLIVLYLFFAAVSIFWSSHFEIALLFKYLALAVSTLVFCITPSYLNRVTNLSSVELLSQIFFVLFPVAVLSTVYSVISFYQLNALNQRLEFFGRLDGPITHSVVNALLILVSIGFLEQVRNWWWRGGIIFGIVLLGIGILLSQSRGPMLALCIALPVQLWLLKMYRSLIIIIILLGASILLFVNNTELMNLMTTRGTSLRPEIWSLIWQSMSGNMWLGHSILPEQRMSLPILGEVHHAHNLMIASFYHLGSLGLMLHLGIIIIWFKSILSLQNNQSKAVAFGVFAFTLIHFQFDGGILLTKPDVLWWGVWLPISWVLMEQNQVQIFKALKGNQ